MYSCCQSHRSPELEPRRSHSIQLSYERVVRPRREVRVTNDCVLPTTSVQSRVSASVNRNNVSNVGVEVPFSR
jgi:hypothetical protein